MGRRKRRRVFKTAKRKIPSIFNCPSCGAQAIIVKLDKVNASAMVRCGYCNLSWDAKIKSFEENVDVYSRFVDAFLEGEIFYER